MRRTRLAACLLLACWKVASAADGQVVQPRDAPGTREISLPYAFYNDLFGLTAAYVHARIYPESQSSVLATAMVGSAGSGMLFLTGRDLRLPWIDRLSMDPVASVGYFTDAIAYVNGNPEYAGQQAGTNGSSDGNYVTGDGWDDFFRITFKYLLPIGYGREHLVDAYRVEEGLLASGAPGGESANPLASGKTYLAVRPFYRSQSVGSSTLDLSQKTNGLDLSATWDNRDLVASPARGQSVALKLSRDFGWFDSSNSWTVLSGELDQYFSLGPSDWFRQRVVALDFWTSDSPTWRVQPDGAVAHRAPTYAGASLGGYWRMRGYPVQRFSDKAAIYYAAEYRMIPRWNPMKSWPWLQQRLGVQWVQLVPFLEVGRVAPSWDLGELHSSMKWDAGLGLRAIAKGIVLRVDVGGSPEGLAVAMMVSQPFQF